jgi:hypothetical protein
MASEQIGFPEVPRSITNPNVKNNNALDSVDPMTFLTFIKTVSISFQPDTLQKYYTYYLSKWNQKISGKSADNTALIVDRYRNFIEEISLDYTTTEEKKFLSKLDFSDPSDLEIAIPFYSKKLIEISKYFNEKREDAKFQITRNKIKGSNFGLKKEILELTLNYLKNIQDKDLRFDYEDVRDRIEIEIEELYDYYPTYFDQDPDVLIYDNKDLDYGLDIFLRDDASLIEEVFGDLNLAEKLLKESDSLFETKRNLTKKYISTDFYFLSTGSTVTNFVSGLAFTADNKSLNFSNRNYPTTASTERNNTKTGREVGFFKPQKTSIVLVDGKRNSFHFNFENIEPNTIYYFPDPNIIGRNGDIITFVVDDDELKMNQSSGFAANLPVSKESDSKFYGYSSTTELGNSKYLDKIFESGYIQDSKHDIFGNLYGLFKDGSNFKQSITTKEQNIVKSLLLNGHLFYDDVFYEDFSFDYDVDDDSTFEYINRSGITTFTNGFSALSSGAYTIFGRFFSPYQELSNQNSETLDYILYDGGFMMDGSMPFDDTISSDLYSYPSDGMFYYDTLLEAGLESTPNRALLDPSFPLKVANFRTNIRPNGLSSFSINCGLFTTPFKIEIPSQKIYIEDVFEPSRYSLSSFTTENLFNRLDLKGTIYVRNQSTNNIDTILNSIPYLNTLFTEDVLNEIDDNVEKFELVNDTLFIATTNYFVAFKFSYVDGSFEDTYLPVISHEKNENSFSAITNRYKIKQSVLFAKTSVSTLPLSSSSFNIDVSLYSIDLNKLTEEQFDYSVAIVSPVTIVKLDTPVLSYNSRPNILSISFLLKDQNDFFEIHELDFDAVDYAHLTQNVFRTNSGYYSNTLDNNYNRTLSVYVSSSATFKYPNIIII